MTKTGLLFAFIFLFSSVSLTGQDLLLLDRSDDNKIVNDSVITIYSTDPTIIDLTKYFTMVNNTERTLNLYLRKIVHTIADSTIDYFCFGPKCWPETDTTDSPAILDPGEEDYSFASHVVHFRRFEMPPLPPGFTSITYVIYDEVAFSEPVEARVTVNYHLSPVSIHENKETTVSVFPNPVINRLTMQTNEIVSGEIDLAIIDINGRIAMQRRVNITNGSLEIEVDELKPGLYFAQLMQENKRFSPAKFVVGK